jgi:hypothetical protein
MRILFALLSALAGLALVFGGYRIARFLIPLMGFMAGLSIGGAVIADASSASFLGTALGIIVGLTTGLALAVFAYLYYSLAIIVLAGGIGYWAGSGFMLLLGFSPDLLSALAGITLGIAIGLTALLLNAPKYVLIVLTSIAGSVATIGGILLLFNKIPLDFYSYTTAKVSISNSFIWTVATLALLAVGMMAQIKSTNDYDFEEWTSEVHNHHAPPNTTPHATQAH